MLEHIRLNRGLDIAIKGSAEPRLEKTIVSDVISVRPTEFRGVIPKLLVKEGDEVKAGTLIFMDKKRPEIGFASPCSGVVEAVVRGEKRKLLEIRIKADKEISYLALESVNIKKATKDELAKILLESGMWPVIKQRPYGTIANYSDTPKAIFISGFDSAPLAADLNYVLRDEAENLQAGVDVLNKFTSGGVFIGLQSKDYTVSPLHKLKDVKHYCFDGAHPAGNVGVQIHHISPVNKGEVVWTVDPVHVAAIGKLFLKRVYDMAKLVAVAGPRVAKPAYVKALPGMQMKDIQSLISKDEVEICDVAQECRYISGNILSGANVGANGSLDFYSNTITVISEGNYHELLGWAKPFRCKKFSFSHGYFSWLTPKKKYDVDSNLNGGVRAFVVTGLYEKVLPMDIYPVYLLKAILAGDIDKMEKLGIYEVVEEDFALCEYVCPSKIEVQEIIANGIDIMIKEMA